MQALEKNIQARDFSPPERNSSRTLMGPGGDVRLGVQTKKKRKEKSFHFQAAFEKATWK